MKRIRLLIVDDNRLLREGIAALLKKYSDIGAISMLGERDDLLRKLQSFKPNVMLLDLGFQNQNSLHLVEGMRIHNPEVHVIAMDLVPSHSDVLDFVRAGISGFILKDATIDDFLKTIRSVSLGEKVLPPIMAGSLFSQIVNHAVNGEGKKSSNLMGSVRMTKRERQVIDLVCDGMSNKEIADKLCLSTYTVKSHVHNILEKLALHTRVQIARFAHDSKRYQEVADTTSLMHE